MTKKAFDKIAAGLEGAIEIARGEAGLEKLPHLFAAVRQPIPAGADAWAVRVCTALLKDCGIIGRAPAPTDAGRRALQEGE